MLLQVGLKRKHYKWNQPEAPWWLTYEQYLSLAILAKKNPLQFISLFCVYFMLFFNYWKMLLKILFYSTLF